MAVAKFIFWICATVTYLHDPESRYAGFVNWRAWLIDSRENLNLRNVSRC